MRDTHDKILALATLAGSSFGTLATRLSAMEQLGQPGRETSSDTRKTLRSIFYLISGSATSTN